ncbi:hypothetical protein SAMN05216338_1003324 [Bradyrhizobium sp. Rc2d]|uniref:hypothetical protein n=1 Tax=Bradyrhizobium sp. Rc2d TaxID=1855321 RepID=UPI0008903856|nr:hypothetical protein [Bradyrhizobium sp. Rc2d]SDG88554.1 hypothetical protein SAMN05216338_1003324 [Bradyrhizobium sp. Rc2d]
MKKVLISATLLASISAPGMAQTTTACPPSDGYGTNYLRWVANDPKRSPNDRQKAAQALNASPSDRQTVAMNLGWDPTGLTGHPQPKCQ